MAQAIFDATVHNAAAWTARKTRVAADPPSPAPSGWTLTSAGFERLLAALDPDRERAAVAYEQLRQRIAGLLQWWGSSRGEELADVTLDRVARKLEEGAAIMPDSLGAYVRGVARMVYYESARQERRVTAIEQEAGATQTTTHAEEALACLDRCLASLTRDERQLVLRYYGDGKKEETRRQLAAELGISPTALRIRTHRLRERLERSMTASLQQP